MKRIKIYALIALFTFTGGMANAQAINWGAVNKQKKHMITVHAGLQNGVQKGIAYGYKINQKLFPVYLNIDYSVPAGNTLTDDFKSRIGGNIRWVNFKNFQFSTGIYGVFRRYNNEFVQLTNFGSDFNGVAGYYRRKFFVAAEAGFDKAIVTHFKHSTGYRDQYSDVIDGWYEPSTGGNFYYGLQGGFSFSRHHIYLKLGKTIEQDFKTKPLFPVYAQLGYNLEL